MLNDLKLKENKITSLINNIADIEKKNEILTKENNKFKTENKKLNGETLPEKPPFFFGEIKQLGGFFSSNKKKYIEINPIKGILRIFKLFEDYPKNPREIIDIRNFKLLKKLKKVKDYYDLEITYTKTKKNGDKIDKVENFRLRNSECRNKWHDSLLAIWKNLIKGGPIPKITKNVLLFIDDRIGIIQEIGN